MKSKFTMDGFLPYCPDCKKFVPDKEVTPVVTEHLANGMERINRAFHFPNCVGHGELYPKKVEGIVNG